MAIQMRMQIQIRDSISDDPMCNEDNKKPSLGYKSQKITIPEHYTWGWVTYPQKQNQYEVGEKVFER